MPHDERSPVDEIRCPKCQAPMRGQERSGVVIDRCTGCGGIFLDRGELERLIEFEGQYLAGEGPWAGRGRWESREEEEEEEHRGYGRYGQRWRRGLLGDLFDFG